MGSSECREVPLEAAETMRDASQGLILSHQRVRTVPGGLQRRGTASESPTPSGDFFHDLRYAGGEQVVDSSELLRLRQNRLNGGPPWLVLF